MKINHWIDFIRSSLYPRRCLLCDSPTPHPHGLCDFCLPELPHNLHACPRCALPLPESAPENSLCGNCLSREPPFASSFVPLRYEPPVNHLITDLKFHGKLHLVRPLGELFISRLPQLECKPDLLLPVPLHPSRLRERGFNQSLELARILAGHYAIRLDLRSCQRIRPTTAQSGLNEKERRRNLRAAFKATGDVKGKHIALFDDVITTGATLTELSSVLLRAGARRIDAWALARTPEN